MTDRGDFDPAREVEGTRKQLAGEAAEEAKKRAAEEAGEQRRRAREEEYRANILKLLRYADEKLKEIREPVVSEFVVTERWWTPESGYISLRKKRADQDVISTTLFGLFRRIKHKVATRHSRQNHYHGSWLSLHTQYAPPGSVSYPQRLTTYRSGVVKLRQPRAGYAYVSVSGDWDPRNVGKIDKFIISLSTLLRGELSKEIRERSNEEINRRNPLRIYGSLEEMYESLEEATEEPLGPVEKLTREVAQALDFVATGQPPEPKRIEPVYEYPGD